MATFNASTRDIMSLFRQILCNEYLFASLNDSGIIGIYVLDKELCPDTIISQFTSLL